MQELKAMKARIETLEKESAKKNTEMESMKQDIQKARTAGPGKVDGAVAEGEPTEPKWYDRIELSGALDSEFGNTREDFKDNAVAGLPSDKVRENDLTLATV